MGKGAGLGQGETGKGRGGGEFGWIGKFFNMVCTALEVVAFFLNMAQIKL